MKDCTLSSQNEKESVALIPAVHMDGRGRKSASLQIVTDEGAHQIWYEGMEAVISRAQNRMAVGKSVFSPEGLVLDAEGGGARAFGRVCFEGVTPLGYDIMGPFCLVPGMECRHKVVSMRHRVQGELNINGRRYVFDDGAGYLEGDRGCSFPSRYVWTQCISREPSCSIMLAGGEHPHAAWRLYRNHRRGFDGTKAIPACHIPWSKGAPGEGAGCVSDRAAWS